MEIDSSTLSIALMMFLLAGMFESRIKLSKLQTCFNLHIKDNNEKKK